MDNSDEERTANSDDQYIGAEFALPNCKGERIMGRVKKRLKYDDSNTSKGNYNTTHSKYLYKVEYPDGTTEQLEAKIIAENMMSQVDSEVNHYHVLT